MKNGHLLSSPTACKASSQRQTRRKLLGSNPPQAAGFEPSSLRRVQFCHAKRNTQAPIDELRPLVARDSDGSLEAIGVEPAQAVADLVRLGELISNRQPAQAGEVEQLHRRYLAAAPPRKGLEPAWRIDCACWIWIAGTCGVA